MTKLIGRAIALAALLGSLAGEARAQYVYWIDTSWGAPALRRAQVYGGDLAEIALPPGSLPEGLAFSPSQGKLVFGESAFAGAAIRQSTPTLGAPLALVGGQSCVRGVAAHPVNGHLYWTTSNLVTGSQLWHADEQGAGAQVLRTLGPASNLRGIALDAAAGRLYLADFGEDAILSVDLDGSNLAVFLALEPGAGPWGVMFDPVTQRVWWSEYGAGRIRSSAAIGGPVVTVYDGLADPTYLERLPDGGVPDGFFLLWSEAGAGAQQIVLALPDGSGAYLTNLEVGTYGGIAYVPGDALDVDLALLAPAELSLAPVAPSPATAASVVRFALPAESRARLSVVDVQGRRVASLLDATLPAGRHSVPLAAWAGRGTAAGVYFVRLEANGRALVRKFVVAD